MKSTAVTAAAGAAWGICQAAIDDIISGLCDEGRNGEILMQRADCVVFVCCVCP